MALSGCNSRGIHFTGHSFHGAFISPLKSRDRRLKILINEESEMFTANWVLKAQRKRELRFARQVLSEIFKAKFLFVCFVALRPKSTAMVIAGLSVHLTTLFSWAGVNKRLTSNSCTYFRL